MKKNDEYIITIEDIGNDGEGIGHLPVEEEGKRGIAVFVKDAVMGDVVRIGLTKVKKNYAYARVIEVIKPSPYRVEPVCKNARRCGGCLFMQMSYEKQLAYKWNKVKNCLERIGEVENVASLMEPIYGMKVPFNYRNKMQFPVGLNRDGEVEIGFYAGRTHSIIDLETCAIGHKVNDFIVKHLRAWLTKWQEKTGNFIYDEETNKGLVRHILTRVGFTTKELMVCLVVNGTKIKDVAKEDLIEALNNAVAEYNASFGNAKCEVELGEGADGVDKADAAKVIDSCDEKIKLTSVSININQEKTNRILGDRCETLYGKAYITDYIGDIKFQISPMSFYQVNPVQTKVLYDKAVEYADLHGTETVWDMYCGIGTITLSLAAHAKKVYGVEIVPQAIDDAKENAKINQIENAEFFCGKSEEVVPEFYANTGMQPDVIVVDPPRKGCDADLLDTISDMAPKRLVYVSCDPATLARDVKILQEKGFCLEKVSVVDQFSHSGHVESVVLITRKDK